MKDLVIYRYIRDDGGITVSPNAPNKPYSTLHRITADVGKMLTNGFKNTVCVDAETTDGWIEIDDPDYITTETADTYLGGEDA